MTSNIRKVTLSDDVTYSAVAGMPWECYSSLFSFKILFSCIEFIIMRHM